MGTWRRLKTGMGIAAVCWALTLWGGRCLADESDARKPKTRMELQLTEEFYRALRDDGAKTYSTDQSDEYLRRIAVSTRFMVETNLRLLEQQERIILLLEALKATGDK